jgi:hypothetical protein
MRRGEAARLVPEDASRRRAGGALDADRIAGCGRRRDLTALLEDRVRGGTERRFSQTQDRPQRSLARILAFDDADGARTYLAWLEDHLDEVIGPAELLVPPDVDGVAFLALSEPECLCPKATDVYLAAWAKGSTVLTLEVGGKGVETADVQALVKAFDLAVAA